MEITEAAARRLTALLRRAPVGTTGFRLAGWRGTCRGATPELTPVAAAAAADLTVATDAGVRLFIALECQGVCARARLDYDGALLGRGLTLGWEHQKDCPCSLQ
jgi:Fe-S cluster assembly iron-binding protein IscA